MTRDTQSPAELSLLGGPLHRLGLRLGLVRGNNNTALIGLMLGPALWLVIVALALMEGVEDRLFDLALVAGMRACFLPLFFTVILVAPLTAFHIRNGPPPPPHTPEQRPTLGTVVMDATGS